MATVSTNIKIDEDLKKNAQLLFASLGLNLSTAINMFLSQAVREQAMPFRSHLYGDEIPNAETLQAIKDFHEGKHMSKTFDSVEELMKDLDA